MMVSSAYLLADPPPPGAVRRFIDQHAVPAAIDAAACAEIALDRLGQQTRRQPVAALGVAFGIGAILGFILSRES